MSWWDLFFVEVIEGEKIEGNGFVSPKSKIHRFLMHGCLDLPVTTDSVDLSSISEGTLSTLKLILSRIEIDDLLDFLHLHNKRRPSELSPLHKTIPFLLALSSGKPEQRETVLDEALELLATPEQFVLFVRYFMDHPRTDEKTKTSFSRFVQMWYGKQSYRALAKMISEDPDYDGWSHRKILKYGYVTSMNPWCQAVLDYACNGMRSLIMDYCDSSKVANVIEYFKATEGLKRTRDSKVALKKITHCPETIKTVHPRVLQDKNVIKALIKRMDVRQLLNLIDFISFKKFFRNADDSGWDFFFVQHVCYRLNNSTEIKKARLHPSESFIAHQSYLYRRKTLNEFASDNGIPTTPEPLISMDIVSALESQMEIAFKNLRAIHIDITVVIDPWFIREQFCGKEEHIPTYNAAAFMAVALKKSGGGRVNIFTFDKSDSLVELKEDSVSSLATSLKSRSIYKRSSAIRDFASQTSADLLVVIGYSLELNQYFEIAKENRQTRKFVFCNLTEGKICSLLDHNNILITAGFNKNTCHFITAFAFFSFPRSVGPPSKIAHIRQPGQ